MPEPIRPSPIRATRGLDMTSLHDVELLESLLVDGQAEAGDLLVEVHEAVLGLRLAFEHIPEELVAHLDVDDGKVLGHRRVQAGHYHMGVVHLAPLWDDGHAP